MLCICGEHINPLRVKALQHLGIEIRCLECGEQQARRRRHCVVPMHKSNYVAITNLEDLKGINSKGGYYR